MYEVDWKDVVIELTNIPKSSVGAPIPIVIADEQNVTIAFYLQNTPASWDGTTIRVVGYRSEKEPIAIVKFEHCYSHMFGPPNDEAFSGHPLASRGLEPYSFYEIQESSWVRKLEKMNSVHPYHKKEQFMENKKHYIFSFHDSTFECIAREYKLEVINGSMKDAMEKIVGSFK
jgi:hypothetical protein